MDVLYFLSLAHGAPSGTDSLHLQLLSSVAQPFFFSVQWTEVLHTWMVNRYQVDPSLQEKPKLRVSSYLFEYQISDAYAFFADKTKF